MKRIDNNERLPISALKQYIYCKRRFALMHIECQWGSNYKIVEGDFLHKKVDDPFFNEKRGNIHIDRSIPVFSDNLNLYGIADIVEFINDDDGIKIDSKIGKWRINPIEYKNGKPESSNADKYQLCAVSMCLEEMFNATISTGDIYYGKIKRRVLVDLSDELKNNVLKVINEIQILFDNQTLPPKPEDQNCSLCSLIDICMPNIFNNKSSNREKIDLLLKGGS